jgi:hypothetical protein
MPYTSNTPLLLAELVDCLEVLYEILEDLEDIRIALERGQDLTLILNPPFDPLKTFGKY